MVTGESPRDVAANVLYCNIVVSDFELQSSYYVHFWINTFRKGIYLLIRSTMILIEPQLVYKEGFGN